MITLPGLIDPHVHLRDPDQTHKEDFYTGTATALAGGFTMLLDMPNNATPIITKSLLENKIRIAKQKIVCDVGFYFGSLGNNLAEFEKVKDQVIGLKVYLNQTTGNYIINETLFEEICKQWKEKTQTTQTRPKPILVHAEEDILEKVVAIGKKHNQHIHVCHISTEKELRIVMQAKKEQTENIITCGVTPHHLFLSEKDIPKLGSFAQVKPNLKPLSDIAFLWKNLDAIDVIESDHAPHTREEKTGSTPAFGLPGLETTLPLLLTAMHEKKLTIETIIRLCSDNPVNFFTLKREQDTTIEVDENEEWIIQNKDLKTKAGWSPFDGWKVKGRVKKVFIRGTKVFEDGRILVEPGFGRII
jgi:carbamoyl-phosphate synthase/aspartate carbamoyltransferase/dihydroorotase